MAVRLAEKFSVKTGSLPAMPRLELGQTKRSLRLQVSDSLNRFLQQTDVNVLTFETVIVIESVCVDERGAAAPVLRDDFFASFGVDFLAELRELGSSMAQRDDIFGCNCHYASSISTKGSLFNVHNSVNWQDLFGDQRPFKFQSLL
jgi:hypothetical protein